MNLEINKDMKKEHRSSKPRAPDEAARRPEKTGTSKALGRVKTYQSDSFRNVRSMDENEQEALSDLTLKPEAGKAPAAYFRQKLETDHAEISIGRLEDHSTVLMGSKKDGYNPLLNTDVQKTVDMNRAKSLFGKDFTTYAERENSAFCQFIGEETSSQHFLRYLENAAMDSETKDVKEVFPFMGRQADLEAYRGLLRQKAQFEALENSNEENPSFALQVLKQEIEQLRSKIYEDQYRRVQFKKQLDQLLKSNVEAAKGTEEESDEFWLWVWLKKLLHAIEEEIDAVSQAGQFNSKEG